MVHASVLVKSQAKEPKKKGAGKVKKPNQELPRESRPSLKGFVFVAFLNTHR